MCDEDEFLQRLHKSRKAREHRIEHDAVMKCVFQMVENRAGDSELPVQRESEVEEKITQLYEAIKLQLISEGYSQVNTSVDFAKEALTRWLNLTEGLDTDTKLISVLNVYIKALSAAIDERLVEISISESFQKVIGILRKLSYDQDVITADPSDEIYCERFTERLHKVHEEDGCFIMPIFTNTHASYALWEPGTSADFVTLSLFNGGDGCEQIHPEIMSHQSRGGHKSVLRECCICELSVLYAQLLIKNIATTRNLRSFYHSTKDFLAKQSLKVNSTQAFLGQYAPFKDQRVCIREQGVGNCAFHNLRYALRHYTRNYESIDGTVPACDAFMEGSVCIYLKAYLRNHHIPLSKVYGGIIIKLAQESVRGLLTQFIPWSFWLIKRAFPYYDMCSDPKFNTSKSRSEILYQISQTEHSPSLSNVNIPYIHKIGGNQSDCT